MINLSRANQDTIYPIIGNSYKQDEITKIDLGISNLIDGNQLSHNHLQDLIPKTLNRANAQVGIGGYGEKRSLYRSSDHFANSDQERNIHLGVDIWVPAGTAIYAPVEGVIHSYAYNKLFLDYGYTLILQHNIKKSVFHTLYGHLGSSQWDQWQTGKSINSGTLIGHIGEEAENGGWYPHLHFQLIIDLGGSSGDYPGVCSESEKEYYLNNCPDPDWLIEFKT